MINTWLLYVGSVKWISVIIASFVKSLTFHWLNLRSLLSIFTAWCLLSTCQNCEDWFSLYIAFSSLQCPGPSFSLPPSPSVTDTPPAFCQWSLALNYVTNKFSSYERWISKNQNDDISYQKVTNNNFHICVPLYILQKYFHMRFLLFHTLILCLHCFIKPMRTMIVWCYKSLEK